ncbi:group III truncated hemoglobin [Telmatospirillum siberiense]|uniref:Globin family protein n=1 Tax=Telmatospirillum siberiense TaxID=382514 RepID=A0A2N3PTV2_9PROT|nr:group III truncated hemoglobin [Telmatospirillum siberiense]PKU23841.1 globin family protein [Telmatospirillum siberiense]
MSDPILTEQHISDLVRGFYARARADDLLGPMFAAAIDDWEGHFKIVEDFWSHALLGTARYRGTPFGPHMRLPIELEHFGRWLALFTMTAEEVLPQQAAPLAIAKARHMTESFKAGLFPWKDADGNPSRHMPKRP